jgi:GAF domain-containing protein
VNPAVLVLENDRGTRKLLDALLSRLGLEVDVVAFASDAILLLGQVEYDFVFADPDVLEWLEGNRPALLERSVVLSAVSPAQHDRIRARWRGVRTIRKPFELSEIVELGQMVAGYGPRRSGSASEQFARRSVAAGAKSGVVIRLDASGLSPVTWFGYAPGAVESFFPMPLEAPLPLCIAVRHARPVWVASLQAAANEYPQFIPVWEQFATRALAAVPVMHDGIVLGVAGWAYREAQRFEKPQQDSLLAIAAALSDALWQSGERSTA